MGTFRRLTGYSKLTLMNPLALPVQVKRIGRDNCAGKV
jgi:hypothetical protein